jgi:hypothetical protein
MNDPTSDDLLEAARFIVFSDQNSSVRKPTAGKDFALTEDAIWDMRPLRANSFHLGWRWVKKLWNVSEGTHKYTLGNMRLPG